MRASLLLIPTLFWLGGAQAASLQAHMTIITDTVAEEYNPDAETADVRITSRTQSHETWKSQLRIDSVGADSFVQIQRNFMKSGMEFHDVLWGNNQKQLAPNAAHASFGMKLPVWPVTLESDSTTWTLLDLNRNQPDRGSQMALVKTAESRSGGKAEFNAGFQIEMMRSQPVTGLEEFDAVAPGSKQTAEPDALALVPYVYNLSAKVSGFGVKSDISGTSRAIDINTMKWSESKLGPPMNGSEMPGLAYHTRTGTRHEGAFESKFERPGLPQKLVSQLIDHPETVSKPLRLESVLTEEQRASDEPGAGLISRRITKTGIVIDFTGELPDAASLNKPADALAKPGKPGRSKP